MVTSAQSTSYTVAEFSPPPSNQFRLFGLDASQSRVGQTFSASRDGRLDSIRLLLAENGPHPSAVVVEVRTVDGHGNPTPDVVTSAAAYTSNLTSIPSYFTATFNGVAVLRAGKTYAVTLRLFEPGTGLGVYGDLAGIDPYEGGGMVRSSDDGLTWSTLGSYYDLAFRVTASAPVITSPTNTFGAGKLSLDLITGREWLDLPLTQNRSPREILNGYGGFIAGGLRFADGNEVRELLEHFGFTTFNQFSTSSRDLAAAQAAIDALGATAVGAGNSTTGGHALHPSSTGNYTQFSIELNTSASFCESAPGFPCTRALPINSVMSPDQVTSWVGAALVRDDAPVDQSFYPLNFIGGDISVSGYSIGGSTQQMLAQTFTPSLSGALSRVAVQVGGFGGPTAPVHLEIHSVSGGVPTNTVLTSIEIPVAAILNANPTNAFIPVTLPTPLAVTAGTPLALVLSSTEQIGSYGWQASTAFNSPAVLYSRGIGFFRGASDSGWRMSGNTDYGFRTYVVAGPSTDGTAPHLTLPAIVSASATASWGAMVTYSVTAADDVDPQPSVSCAPASGSTFPLGSTQVTCTARDASGNTADGSFTVTVVDDLRPLITHMPVSFQLEATAPEGALAQWDTPTAIDNVDGAVPVVCTKTSPSVLPVGRTAIACTASDRAGNIARESFTITVADTAGPILTILTPDRDAVLTQASVMVSVLGIDIVGVTTLSVNGVSAILTAGSAQNGTWQVQLTAPPSGSALTVSAVGADFAANATSASLVVDNDGIAASIDPQPLLFNNSFSDGTTIGTIGRPLTTIVTATKTAAGPIRVSVLGDATKYADVTLCTGSSKYVHLVGGESVDVNCSFSTVTVKAVAAAPTVDLYKLITQAYYYSYTYYYTTSYSCGAFGRYTCWSTYPVTRTEIRYYTYYYWTPLQQGQSLSTGSPATAGADNTQSVQVFVIQRQDDNPDTDAVLESFDLDPGESVDTEIVAGEPGAPEQIHATVLAGSVDVTTISGTKTLNTGEELLLPAELLPQTIAFPLMGTQYFGSTIALTATASSGLPLSFSGTGGCSVSGANLSITAVGTCTVTASQPGDARYAPAIPQTQTFAVYHAWSGILQPINANGSSVFKLGTVVPVKFQLTGGSAAITTLGAKLTIAKVANGIAGTDVEAVSTLNADSGNVFRYDVTSSQYVFNWGTKGLSEGTWQIRIDLLDGNTGRTVIVSLKK